MFRPHRMFTAIMSRIQARRELRRFKNLLNVRASSMAVQLTLSGALQSPRFSSRWLV